MESPEPEAMVAEAMDPAEGEGRSTEPSRRTDVEIHEAGADLVKGKKERTPSTVARQTIDPLDPDHRKDPIAVEKEEEVQEAAEVERKDNDFGRENEEESENGRKVGEEIESEGEGCEQRRKDIENMPSLAMYDFGQCDARRCSGQKLRRHGKLKVLRKSQPFKGVLLFHDCPTFLSREDEAIVKQSGLCVVDCSWNKIEALTQGPLRPILARAHVRKLPFLLAANPCHYGRPYELNCAEALAAGLFIAGFNQAAETVMASFSWGASFFGTNLKYLDKYDKDGEGRSQAQMAKLTEMYEQKRASNKTRFNSSVSHAKYFVNNSGDQRAAPEPS